MKDRFGQDIYVYWAEHEIEWINAANTLDRQERRKAFSDIASMSSRSYEAVVRFASYLRERDARQAKEWAEKQRLKKPANVSLPPSELKPPTRAQLMGAR